MLLPAAAAAAAAAVGAKMSSSSSASAPSSRIGKGERGGKRDEGRSGGERSWGWIWRARSMRWPMKTLVKPLIVVMIDGGTDWERVWLVIWVG